MTTTTCATTAIARPAVVTGAASGIGRHVTSALAGSGIPVLAVDSDVEAVNRVHAGQSMVQVAGCDVRDEAAVEAALAGLEEAHGAPSLVVTCAARTELADADEITVEQWRTTLDVNVTGSFVVARIAARMMRMAGGGSVVLVGSQLGRVTRQRRAAYSTSKAAIEMLAKVLAYDFAPWGVRVNCLAPGPVLTERTRDRLLGEDRPTSGDRLLLNRYLVPDDVVAAITYLAGPGSAAVTGTTLLVDGGYCVT